MKFARQLCGCLAVACVSMLGCRPTPESPTGGLSGVKPTDDVPTKMVRFAEQAAIDARKVYRVSLDYSPDSIATVEDILDRFSRAPNFAKYTDKDVRAEALIFGAYIGEVIRRQHGGRWAEDHPQAGAGTYPLLWGQPEHTSFPYAWCYKRLTLGPPENVLHKYQYFVSKDLDPSVQIEVQKTDLRK